ncbi:MAG: 3-hydroxy-3-methylglutaryl-CoA reductase [Bacteroidetes bacterium]|nr:MAG: 3-hydroxy-3-methylglutaryl-CoA reductase [Bacteroidota bacterium]
MSTSLNKAIKIFAKLQETGSLEEKLTQLREEHNTREAKQPKNEYSSESFANRKAFLEKETGASLEELTKTNETLDPNHLKGNIENFIGTTTIPTGVAGPLRINGSEAKGDFYVPLATTEGALVASYHRGAKATLLSGGIATVCLTEGVKRSPLFGFKTIELGIRFLMWVTQVKDKFPDIVAQHTSHGKLNDVQLNIEGNHIILTFEYLTGDASGQNMVTICTDAICHYLIEHTPIKPSYWYVEGNYSGDKKASVLSFSTVRGKKVTAECVVKAAVLKDVLKTTAKSVAKYWTASIVSVVQTGSIGAQGHFANGLTALFMATGQDVACVSEAAVGVTRMEVVNDDDLYISVMLPNLIVGTIGGGTKFATQQECLALMDCVGLGKARKFAEICAGLLLCGELSIASALAEGHFTSAHQSLGR